MYEVHLIVQKGYENEVFKKGSISIIDIRTGQKAISIESEELTFDLNDEGKVETNVVELPYGKQSLIIYQDFNFDGMEDLAIMDGQYSCYHGPSYQIYLEKDGQLQHSPEFTRLAQQYCGMFQVDREKGCIYTYGKSGCCWHETSTFKVKNGVPEPILVVEEDARNYPFIEVKTAEWKDGKEINRSEKNIDLKAEGLSKIVSFRLAKNDKLLVLFEANGGILNYALVQPSGAVEFSFPIQANYDKPDFTLSPDNTLLTFKNENAVYQVYERLKQGKIAKIGILVTVKGKKYDLKGDLSSLTGSLQKLRDLQLDNLYKK